jgi:hypothetical protein
MAEAPILVFAPHSTIFDTIAMMKTRSVSFFLFF